MKKILVLGSLNIDLTMQVERLPKIGETIHGKSIDYLIGGKGANQAVAASRIADGVALVGCVGADTFGEKILKHLSEEKLDLSHVVTKQAIFTGMASIFKTELDNAIVVIPGANDWCTEDMVDRYAQEIKQADVLLLQLEIPLNTVIYAAKVAHQAGVKVILNPAPYYDLPDQVLYDIDYITPNDSEFAGLYGSDLRTAAMLENAMIEWQASHPTTRLIVTRGSEGSSYVEKAAIVTQKAKSVSVVDTTGAGDTYNGILAVALAEGKTLEEAVHWANQGAALSIQKFGAQGGMPTRAELEAHL